MLCGVMIEMLRLVDRMATGRGGPPLRRAAVDDDDDDGLEVEGLLVGVAAAELEAAEAAAAAAPDMPEAPAAAASSGRGAGDMVIE